MVTQTTAGQYAARCILLDAVRELYHSGDMLMDERNPYTGHTAYNTLCVAHEWATTSDAR